MRLCSDADVAMRTLYTRVQHCVLQAISFVPAGCIFVTIQYVLLYFFQRDPCLLP